MVVGEEPMCSVTVGNIGDKYILYYENVLFSIGEGEVSDIQYEEIGTEVFITYQAETPRLAWSPDGEGFIDMEAVYSGTPSQIGQRMKAERPDDFLVTMGNTGRVGGKTEDLEVGRTVYQKDTQGSRRYSQCEFMYSVWYMTGDGYDGNWVSTMETWDHDWWNSGSTDFINVHTWIDEEEVEPPEFEERFYPKWHYTRLPFQAAAGLTFSGYTGYFEDDYTSSYGWYYEQGRNTQGSWGYYSYSPWPAYQKESWYATNTGSNFQNTQTVATRRMEDPHSLMLIWYITVIGYWGGRTGYSWYTELFLQDPLGV